MKKFLTFALLATVAILAPISCGASLAFMPLFGKPTLSVNDIEALTQNFSSFNGEDYDQFSSYDGNGMRSLIDTSRVFTITITNTTTARNGSRIYLMPGLSYSPGRASINGVLYDSGNIVDIAANTLTGTTASGSPKTIDYLYSYLDKNPTVLNMIKVSSASTSAQCATQLIKRELSPFQDLESIVVPLAQNQDERTFRDKIATVNLLQYNIIACPQVQLELPLFMAASDTTTIEMYFAKTMNGAASLKQQVAGALQIAPAIAGGSNIPVASRSLSESFPLQKRLV